MKSVSKIGFDNDKYIKIQSEAIKKRFNLFDKLYLEVGGKLFEDNHAARVLPGFQADSKINMFLELKDDLEIIFCISASAIAHNKTRADYGITYDTEVIRLIESSRSKGFNVNSVVVTLYEKDPVVDLFIKKLKRHNIKTYIHTYTLGYPTDVDTIVSDKGYGANPYIETTKKLILVNAPGPGSGKLATCLSQLYHEHKMGVNAGYAKFETFPVWNLALKDPVNIAYEAATADLKDVNMIDPYHLAKYNISAVNYNRDIETFPILTSIINKIAGKSIYYSPTDMGVNKIGECIINKKVVELASKKEIIRRYYQEQVNFKNGIGDEDTIQKIKLLMNELEIDIDLLDTIKPALDKQSESKKRAMSIKLPNGKVITGRETDLLSPASSLILNAIKIMTKIPDDVYLLSEAVLKPILDLRKNSLLNFNKTLELNEVLIALSICAVTNPIISKALENIKLLQGCDAHATYILTDSEFKTLKSLKINITQEPVFYNELL